MNLEYKKRSQYLLMLAPAILLLIAFTYTPLIKAFIDSFYDFRVSNGEPIFSGLDNYYRLFADEAFIAAVINNCIYIFFTIIPAIVLALMLALALKKSTMLNRFLRAVFFFPTIIPLVAAATLWSFIFLPGIGLFDYYLSKLIPFAQHNFLGNENTALYALIFISIWKFAGYYMLFFLAGLQSIPDDAMEAALIEGGNKWQCFWYVTLPMLRPTITFVGTVALVYSVTQIDHIPTMTNGGPGHSTTVLLHYIQTISMESQDYGKAFAATVVTIIGLFFLTWINNHLLDRGTHYER